MSVTELLKLGSEGEVPDINRDSETYFLLTSLTSGQSAIITATARLELLLITMKVPFVAVDVATDERAKNLWRRRGNGKRLPVVVHDGVVLGVGQYYPSHVFDCAANQANINRILRT